MKDFFLWAFFNRDGPPGDDDEELEEYVFAMEKLLGQPIEAGRGNAKCLRLTLDKVNMLHRSLIWYLVSSPSWRVIALYTPNKGAVLILNSVLGSLTS